MGIGRDSFTLQRPFASNDLGGDLGGDFGGELVKTVEFQTRFSLGIAQGTCLTKLW